MNSRSTRYWNEGIRKAKQRNQLGEETALDAKKKVLERIKVKELR